MLLHPYIYINVLIMLEMWDIIVLKANDDDLSPSSYKSLLLEHRAVFLRESDERMLDDGT